MLAGSEEVGGREGGRRGGQGDQEVAQEPCVQGVQQQIAQIALLTRDACPVCCRVHQLQMMLGCVENSKICMFCMLEAFISEVRMYQAGTLYRLRVSHVGKTSARSRDCSV